MGTNQTNVFLKPNEGKFLALATISLLEQFKRTAQNQKIPWNPESRKMFREINEAGEALRTKLAKLGFNMHDLPPFMDGDEDEFLTKES